MFHWFYNNLMVNLWDNVTQENKTCWFYKKFSQFTWKEFKFHFVAFVFLIPQVCWQISSLFTGDKTVKKIANMIIF